MNPATRDKKIALTQRRIIDAKTARAKHVAHQQRLDREIATLGRELDWLKDMPTDDAPTPDLTKSDQSGATA